MSQQIIPVTVREAPGDAPRLAALLTQLGYPTTSQQVSDRLGYWLPNPMSRVLVAERDEQVVGYLALHACPYLERTGRWARIESLVVDEPARGAGIGRALVTAAEAVARKLSCRAVEVTSSRSRTDAHSFYRHMGYTDICDRSGRLSNRWNESGTGQALGLVCQRTPALLPDHGMLQEHGRLARRSHAHRRR